MPKYRELVEEVITPKFAADFEKNVPLAEATVTQAGLARTAEVFSTAVSAIDSDSATALVAGLVHQQSYPKSPGSDERVRPSPRRSGSRSSLVKVKGTWLVDDFTPLTGTDDDGDRHRDRAPSTGLRPPTPTHRPRGRPRDPHLVRRARRRARRLGRRDPRPPGRPRSPTSTRGTGGSASQPGRRGPPGPRPACGVRRDARAGAASRSRRRRAASRPRNRRAEAEAEPRARAQEERAVALADPDRTVPAWLLRGPGPPDGRALAAAGYLPTQPSDEAVADARSEAQGAAERAATTILAYDYRHLDDDQLAAGG